MLKSERAPQEKRADPFDNKGKLARLLPEELQPLLAERRKQLNDPERITHTTRLRYEAELEADYEDVLFGSAASGMARRNSDTDTIESHNMALLPFGLFSPHIVLKPSGSMARLVEAEIEAQQERALLYFAGRYGSKKINAVDMLLDYIRSCRDSLDKRIEDKRLEGEKPEAARKRIASGIFIDMLPGFMATIRRLEERGRLLSHGKNEYSYLPEPC